MRASFLTALALLLSGCSQPSRRPVVVIYSSLDSIFARPLLDRFERETGIDVRPVFDSESTKTVGLAHRLLLEKQRPRADVFWNGEFSRTIFLQRKGLLASYRSPSALDIPAPYRDPKGLWTGYACRARVICYDPERFRQRGWNPPASLDDLTAARWKGRVAICDPALGTSSSWATALTLRLGRARAARLFRDLAANGTQWLPGNSVVADYVVKGQADVGITDTDDVHLRKKQGRSIDMILPEQSGMGTMIIPATVAMIKGAPHRPEAQRLIDFLLSLEVEQALAEAAGHLPVRGEGSGQLKKIRSIAVPFTDIGANVEKVTREVVGWAGL